MKKVIERLTHLYKARKESEHILIHQTIRFSNDEKIQEGLKLLKDLNTRISELEGLISYELITKTKADCEVKF